MFLISAGLAFFGTGALIWEMRMLIAKDKGTTLIWYRGRKVRQNLRVPGVRISRYAASPEPWF